MAQIAYSDLAKMDLTEIWLYIAEDSKNQADKFIKYLEQKCLMPKVANRPTPKVFGSVAASGPLAYSPENPPDRADYYFQYGWVLPGVFNPEMNIRCHRYFS